MGQFGVGPRPDLLESCVGCIQDLGRLADQFTGSIAEQFLQAAIAGGDRSVAQEHDTDQCVIENRLLFSQQGRFLQAGFLAFGDDRHQSAQDGRLSMLNADGRGIMQPDGTTIPGDDAVFQFMRHSLPCIRAPTLRCPSSVFGMKMLYPKSGLHPLAEPIAKQGFGVLADETEVEVLCIRFPHDAVGALDKCFVAGREVAEFAVMASGQNQHQQQQSKTSEPEYQSLLHLRRVAHTLLGGDVKADADAAANVADLVAQPLMAGNAGFLEDQGCHVAEHQALAFGILLEDLLLLSSGKLFEGAALPGVGGVGFVFQSQGGGTKPVIGIAPDQAGDFPRHQCRVAQRVRLAGGVLDVGSGQIGAGFDPGTFFHIHAAIVGIPAARNQNVAEVGLGTLQVSVPEHRFFGASVEAEQEYADHEGGSGKREEESTPPPFRECPVRHSANSSCIFALLPIQLIFV